MTDKVRINRLRRMAKRQGMTLHKVSRKDPRAIDYNTFWLVDARSDALVFPPSFGETGVGASIEEIEDYLTKD